MEIQSYITDGEIYISTEITPHHLSPDQLVVDALAKLSKLNAEFLHIVENNKCIGILYTKDLLRFLTHNKMQSLLFHKLNFDIRTAIHHITNTYD
jgi:signal-transduction protein with cAMP-binding, CBS, and nucleotidyltransferase domain